MTTDHKLMPARSHNPHRPIFESISTCTTCQQPFKAHFDSAKARLRQAIQDETDVHEIPSLAITWEEVEAAITYQDCVSALKAANRGPVGYTGPMGATGSCSCHQGYE